MSQLRIKQGGSLIATAMIADATGAPINLQAAQLSISVQTSTGAPIGPITITATGVPGQAIISALASDTANWPVGILRYQVNVTGSGITVPSCTGMLFVEQSV